MNNDKSLEIASAALVTSAFHHRITVQPRWNDFDMLRHLNNTSYFDYFDLGKTAYFHAVIADDIDATNVNAVIANVNATFVAPVNYGEPVDVLTAVIAISERSFYLEQQLVNNVTGEMKCRCVTAMVSFDFKQGGAIPLNPKWVKRIVDYEHNNVKILPPSDNI